MKKDRLCEYIFAIGLCVFSFFSFIVLNQSDTKKIIVGGLIIFTLACVFFIKSQKIDDLNKKTIIFLMGLFAIINIILLYIMGVFFSFYKNPYNLNLELLYNIIVPNIIIIVSSEILRKIFIQKENRVSTIFSTIALVVFDVCIYNNINGITSLENFLMFWGYIFSASVSVNLLCNYVCKRYNFWGNILYRTLMVSYRYVLPIIPDIHMLFLTTLRIIYPYFIYLILESSFGKRVYSGNIKKERLFTSLSYVAIGVMFVFILLVSCEFKYGVISIGSSSMSGKINKGDIVMFEKFNEQSLKKGEVIIFNQDGKKVVHRIISIEEIEDQLVYYTKGDANAQKDDGFRKKEDVEGIVLFKVSNLGWPVIWLNELFN